MSWPARRTEEQQRADRLKTAIDQLGAGIEGRCEIDLGTTPATVGLVVRHRGHEMRLCPVGELWVADAEVETPNGDHPYVTLDATGETYMDALDILAAAMDRARETGERPDVDDDGRLIGSTPPTQCDHEVFERGVGLCVIDARMHAAERWVQDVARLSGQRVDWHYSGGRASVLVLGDHALAMAAARELAPSLDGTVLRWSEDQQALYRKGDPLPPGVLGVG